MKRCNLCGETHDGGCDRSKFDPIFADKITIFQDAAEVVEIEDKALAIEEQQHIAKKRGRPRKN